MDLWTLWVDEWFEERPINLLNIYVLALILIEHHYDKDKAEKLDGTLDFIVSFLYFRGDISQEQREQIFIDLKEETEILSGIREVLFICSKNPQWLQSQYQTISSGKKILLAKPAGKDKILCGHLK